MTTRQIFIKAAIFTLVIASVILLIFPVSWFPEFYDVRYMGLAALTEAVLIYYLPRFFRVPLSTPNAVKKNQAADLLQFLLAIVFFASALGDLGLYQLYKVGFEFDKLLHFFIPLLGGIFLAQIIHDRFEIRPLYACVATFFFIVFSGVFWEFFEYIVDAIFKTRIYGVYGLNTTHDTRLDLLFDACGALLGTTFFYYKNTKKIKASSPLS